MGKGVTEASGISRDGWGCFAHQLARYCLIERRGRSLGREELLRRRIILGLRRRVRFRVEARLRVARRPDALGVWRHGWL